MRNRLAGRDLRFGPESSAKAIEELTPALAGLFSPMAAMALAFGLWALGAQVAVAANFPIPNGALADWRVWFLIAGVLEFAAFRFRSQTPNR